ncbi:MAG TPA: zf-TFIIB domain-containing protein [Candidatus Binatia bacterium]|jgi:hypothetical protein
MPEEKDRYGDKLRDAEQAREDKFFAERDRALLEKMRHGGADADGAPQHATRDCCPRDGQRLVKIDHLGRTAHGCPTCKGMWLDKAEVEELARRESNGWLSRFLGRPR